MSEDPQALGLRLKAERERRGMSTQKIAKGMHVDDWVIDALESGDYQRIGPAVYAKGHLKKYASLLNVSTAPPAPESAAPAVVGSQPVPIVRLDPPKDPPAAWPRLGTVAAVVILAGGVFWWRQTHQASPHQGTSISAAPKSEPAPAAMTSAAPSPTDQAAALAQSEEATDAQGSLAAADGVPPDAPAHAMPTSAVNRPAAPPSANAPAAADLTPGVGKARMRLSFSADSWVDVRDYSGKRVFEGNGRANSVKTIAGMAPFRVYLRSVSGVQLQLNDRAIAIGRQFISGDEARFEAGADGVLRRDVPAAGGGPETAAVSPHG